MIKRRFTYDFIRIFACILVVTVHVAAISFEHYATDTFHWSVSNFFDCVGIIGVPLFFMLSGALLLDPKKHFSYRRFFFHNFVEILLSYVFVIFFYNLMYFFMDCPDHSFASFKLEVLRNTLFTEGHNLGHLWFIPALLGLYLITPLLRKAFADKKVCTYFMILFIFFGIILFTLNLFDIKLFHRLKEVYDDFLLELFFNYTGYFCLGHYLANFNHDRPKYYHRFVALLAVMGIVFTVMTDQIVTSKTGSASVLYNTPFALGHFCSAYGLFALFLHLFKDHKPSGKVCATIAGVTFPIYLFHPFVILMLRKINYPFFFVSPLISIPMTVALIFVLSGLLGLIWNVLVCLIKKMFSVIPVIKGL